MWTLWVCIQVPGTASAVAWPMGKPYLMTFSPALDGRNGHLVALGNVLNGGDGGVIDGDCRALGDGVQGNDHVILGVDLNSDGHNKSPYLL